MAVEIFGANLKTMLPAEPKAGGNFHVPLYNLLRGYNIEGISGDDQREIVIFAPYTHLDSLSRERAFFQANKWRIGAQGMSRHEVKPHTSGIPPKYLKKLGVTDVLVGHSEVRAELEVIAEAVGGLNYDRRGINEYFRCMIEVALEHGFRVFYCVGETEDERQKGKTKDVLNKQMEALPDIDTRFFVDNVVIAYEPRWSIGGGKPIPKPEEIDSAHAQIRNQLWVIGCKSPKIVKVIYGGSMNPDNVQMIMGIEGVDGGLVGTACLDPKKFSGVVNYSSKKDE